MNATCTHCQTTYRVDPAKIPADGVRVRCARCGDIFLVSAEPAGQGATASAEAATPAPPRADTAPAGGGAAPAGQPLPARPPQTAAGDPAAPAAAASAPRPSFGAADPHAKARRLARALISDIVVYHPERRTRAANAGTLRQEFREEIQKSWEEYVAQVGIGFARETPYFREALNEILAGGSRVF